MPRQAITAALMLLIPGYTAAYLTGEMVYVVPTVAACAVIVRTLADDNTTRFIDEGEEEENND